MATKTVLAVDVGSTTIAAAIAGAGFADPQMLMPSDTTTVWPAQVNVGADGSLDCDPRHAATVISRVTRLLGREAQVIAGHPRHADSLIAAALAPALRTARAVMRTDDTTLDVVAATYPSTWPPEIVDAYRRAIAAFAPNESVLIPWHKAIAAQTYPPDPYVDCPVTSLDFGARSASVTMVSVDSHGRTSSLYSITHPTGGFTDVATALIREVAHLNNVEIAADNVMWWEQSVAAVAEGRTAATGSREDMVLLQLPDPVGSMKVPYDEITSLFVERLTERGAVIRQLVDRAPVTRRSTIPGNPLAAVPIVQLTGGFAEDPAVQTAVRHILNSDIDVVHQPAHAAAWGAAKLASERRPTDVEGSR
jgi:hypothetical protein